MDCIRLINPYAPPHAESAAEHSTQSNRLVYIRIWLTIAIVGAMLATTADMFAIILAMSFALPCFLVGVTWASELAQTPRLILIATCMFVVGLLAAVTWFALEPVFVAIAIVYAVVNVILGVKSCGAVVQNRRRIFVALGVSYAIGLLLGPLGVIILTIPSLLFANRNAVQNSG